MLEVLDQHRVDLLVDRHPCRGMRDVDEHSAPLGFADCVQHVLGDVDQLGLSTGFVAEFVHHAYPTDALATDTLTTRELDAFRDSADRFVAELDEEYYLHFAGLKETLELEQIYGRHEELTQLETAKHLEGAPTELWRFACEGFLGNLTRSHQEQLAQVEAELEATIDGEQIPFRMLRPVIANEPDRDRRQRLEETRLRLTDEHLNPVYLDAALIDRDAVSKLDAPNYYELYKRFVFQLDDLAAQCTDLLDATEGLWEET